MANARHHQLIVVVFFFVFTKSSYCFTTTTPSTQDESVTCGKDAVANNAPFIVSIERNGKHLCAGSILNENWVVLAGNCLQSKDEVMNYTLVAGSNLSGGDASTTQKRSINYYVVHDLYSHSDKSYDIGLVYTAKPFTWSSAVAAINLPEKDTTPSSNLISYGWDNNNPEHRPILQVVTVPIMPLDECKSEVQSFSGRTKISTTNICTTFSNTTGGGVDICNTDCSGPLIQKTNNKNVLIGVVLAGASVCNYIGSPTIYALVSSQLSWIIDNQVVPSSSDLFNV